MITDFEKLVELQTDLKILKLRFECFQQRRTGVTANLSQYYIREITTYLHNASSICDSLASTLLDESKSKTV